MLSPDHDLRVLTREAAQSADPHRTQHIALGSGVLDSVPAWVTAQRPGATDIVVADANTFEVAGRDLLERLTQAGRRARALVIDPEYGQETVCCDDEAVASLRTFLASSPNLNAIAVGAGTINDIVKTATHALDRGYQVVPTAASMNGYTSSISAVLSQGVKRTRPTHQPVAVFADVDIIRAAPPVMNQAGFGDLLSKPFSQSDWLLSHLLRGVPYDDQAARLLDGPWRAMLARAEGMGTGDAPAIIALLETLLISGFSMAVAGTSAPASGAEHLISHYWDMEQHCQNEPVLALHGTQVGIGTLVSAFTLNRLIEIERQQLSEAADRAKTAEPPRPWTRETLKPLHPKLTDPVLDEIAVQINKKTLSQSDSYDELRSLAERWPDIQGQLAEVVLPEADMKEALKAAGCARTAGALDVSQEAFIQTITYCRHIRSRFVNFDLAATLGLLPAWAEQAAAWIEGD